MMLNKQNRRLGDFVAGTVVVHEKLTDEVRPGSNATEAAASVNPQISQVSAEELVLIETYLHRRWDLDPVCDFRLQPDCGADQGQDRVVAAAGRNHR